MISARVISIALACLVLVGLGTAGGVWSENVGVYGINQGDLALNSGNYDLSYQGNNLTITKALLNVIADGKTKVYGDADPSLTYQVSGLKNGDTAGAVLNSGSLSRVAGENVGVYGINQAVPENTGYGHSTALKALSRRLRTTCGVLRRSFQPSPRKARRWTYRSATPRTRRMDGSPSAQA